MYLFMERYEMTEMRNLIEMIVSAHSSLHVQPNVYRYIFLLHNFLLIGIGTYRKDTEICMRAQRFALTYLLLFSTFSSRWLVERRKVVAF